MDVNCSKERGLPVKSASKVLLGGETLEVPLGESQSEHSPSPPPESFTETNHEYCAETNSYSSFERQIGEGLNALDFLVPSLHCAGCIAKIERHFSAHPDGVTARVNLGAKRVHFEWPVNQTNGASIASELKCLGFVGEPLLEAEQSLDAFDRQLKHLLWCVGVAGFAAANVMLLSVSVWSGASGATRDLFHWISALIALPAIVYAGQPFFSSAFAALRVRKLNMDVPISLAVVLAGAISLYETMTHGEHAFFDAAVTLLFFLLIGRTLDHMMRAKAQVSVRALLALKAKTATIEGDDGQTNIIAIRDIREGMVVVVRPGETVPVDGRIVRGQSDINWSMVTGESLPQPAKFDDEVYSGLINLTGPLHIKAERIGDKTLLSEIVTLMEEAETRSPHYRKLADMAASIYAPSVHLIALLTLIGWLIYGASWQTALFTAISVLIITCPCALGLAVPVVQITASGIAFKYGVVMKDGTALEKLSEIDTIVFDKTGTLTLASPGLTKVIGNDDELFKMALGLARYSTHPLSIALVEAGRHKGIATFAHIEEIRELPGLGLEGRVGNKVLRLGSLAWVGIKESDCAETGEASLWISIDDGESEKDCAGKLLGFCFEDQVRSGASEMIAALQRDGLEIHVFSGDHRSAVASLCGALNIKSFKSDMSPLEKADNIHALNERGRRVLMVGDGINDGPSLKIAHVSLTPANASDVAQSASSFVMMGDGFESLLALYKLSKQARRVIWQNFALALIYNIVAVPIAVLGGATPIVAAIAMSLSSLCVTLNALKLRLHSFGATGQDRIF